MIAFIIGLVGLAVLSIIELRREKKHLKKVASDD